MPRARGRKPKLPGRGGARPGSGRKPSSAAGVRSVQRPLLLSAAEMANQDAFAAVRRMSWSGMVRHSIRRMMTEAEADEANDPILYGLIVEIVDGTGHIADIDDSWERIIQSRGEWSETKRIRRVPPSAQIGDYFDVTPDED